MLLLLFKIRLNSGHSRIFDRTLTIVFVEMRLLMRLEPYYCRIFMSKVPDFAKRYTNDTLNL